jgi:protein SCO1
MKTPIILLFSAGAALLFSNPATAQVTTNSSPQSCCSVKLPAGPFTDKSIYNTGSKWTTDDLKHIKLGDLSGKPQVVAMFFANCQYACPIIVNDMKRIEAALPENVRTNVGFTLVSFDTQRDTPTALAEYRLRHGLAAGRWTLLHGEPDDVLELAALLGINFKQDAQGQFAHSNLIVVLNARGEIVHQLAGLNQEIKQTAGILEQLTNTENASAQ